MNPKSLLRAGLSPTHRSPRSSSSRVGPKAGSAETVSSVAMLPNPRMDPLFAATVQATEEVILNAMLAAETMTGADGARVEALPHNRLLAALRKYAE